MKKHKFWLIICLLIFTSLVVVACGADEEPTVVPAAEDVSQEEPAEEAVPVEEPPDEPTPEEEETSITILIPEDPAAFSSYVADTGYSQMLMELVMLGVTDIDAEGNIFPELAAELPTVENGSVNFDEENWTMDVTWKLRDDIFWADGEPVTADDVIFTWNAIADPELGTWTDGLDYTDSIEKVDDYTFTVYYNTVYPNFLLQFGGEDFGVWPEHYCDASQGFMAWDCNRDPLSDGPYILDEWETGDHLTFVRNPNYYEEGKPSIDKIFVRVVPEVSVAQQLMLQGDGDLQIWPTESVVESYKESDIVDVSFAPNDRWVMRLIPNLAAKGSIDPVENPHPILSDVRVRQALQMAIDVDTITEEIFLGYSKPTWTEFFRPPYECEVPKPAFDPEGAAALLEQAGWTDEDGDGVRECRGCTTGAEEGYPMSMEFVIYAEYGEELELAQQLIAEMWANIGIETQLGIVEGTTLWAGYEDGGIEQNGEFDINMWDDGYPGVDPTDNQLWTYYYSEAAEPDYGWNVSRYASEDFDAWLDEAYTIDEEYRKEVFCELAGILAEDLPQILLFTAFDASAYNTRLHGVQATVNDTHTWNVADWTVSD
ncbi:MAG: peptide ABC transporter substrate-binding protein [Anaerolineae bacterium]|nr:MAG: peptide ABC transporter substrate-binding protein [Anaerolineae bacterium]